MVVLVRLKQIKWNHGKEEFSTLGWKVFYTKSVSVEVLTDCKLVKVAVFPHRVFLKVVYKGQVVELALEKYTYVKGKDFCLKI